MWIRIGLILFAILALYFGIRILLRTFPQIFTQDNLEKFSKVSDDLALGVCLNKRISNILTRAALICGPLGILLLVQKEQSKILLKKIDELKLAVERFSKEAGIKHFILPFQLLQQRILQWHEDILSGRFVYSEFFGKIDTIQRIMSSNCSLCKEIDLLFEQNFSYLSKIQTLAKGDKISVYLEIKRNLESYQNWPVDIERTDELFKIKEALVELFSLQQQFEVACQSENNENISVSIQTYYEVLGITSDASPDEIKKAYRQAVLRYHPDRKNAELEKISDLEIKAEIEKIYDSKLKLINEAYAFLSKQSQK